uniref:Uncharacterized protein n=1 Tax=Xiphophorus maculatus TaxID=8083 RepID=A0A3B5R7A4_XIPMA
FNTPVKPLPLSLSHLIPAAGQTYSNSWHSCSLKKRGGLFTYQQYVRMSAKQSYLSRGALFSLVLFGLCKTYKVKP